MISAAAKDVELITNSKHSNSKTALDKKRSMICLHLVACPDPSCVISCIILQFKRFTIALNCLYGYAYIKSCGQIISRFGNAPQKPCLNVFHDSVDISDIDAISANFSQTL